MAGNDSGRVIVGVSNSLAGYEALRYAVAEARRRGATLIAVRTFTSSYYGGTRQFEGMIHDAAREAVISALAEAMGGPLRDVPIEVRIQNGVPGRVLAAVADRPGDLIVIGGSDHRTMFGRRRGTVARDCSRWATCPVTMIPAPEMASAGSQSKLARRAVDEALEIVRRG